ncbi:MAG: hypothetical protein R6U84_09905 [Candidatus Cloacimonadales bacterium]
MNKKVVFLLCIFTFSLLNAANLLKFYHRDYQVADRSVFVFDSRPQFSFSSDANKILINFPNTSLDLGLEGEVFHDSKVLKSISYTQNGDDLLVKLALQNSQFGHPEVESFHFSQNKQQYKVVFDIIRNPQPATTDAAQQLAKFYRLVGKEKKSNQVLADFRASQAQLKKAEESKAISSDPEKAKAQPIVSDSEADKADLTKSAAPEANSFYDFLLGIPLSFYLLLLVAIILVILTIRFIISGQRKRAANSSADFWYPTSGFGSEQCQKKIISILHKHNWESDTIARELQLSSEAVEQIIAEIEAK